MTTIQINLIRTPHGDGHDDDIITISRNGEKQYSLTYKDKTATTPVPHRIQLDRDDVFDHLETTFDMLDIDIAPFKQIQVLAPTFPSTLLNVSSLHMDSIRETVFRAVENTMNNWPTVSTIEYLRRSPRLASGN